MRRKKRDIRKRIFKIVSEGKNPRFEYPNVGEYVDDVYQVILCPVCGHKTLDSYWICEYCDWEYDDFPETHYSAANGMTLRQYRKYYEKAVKKAEKAGKKPFIFHRKIPH